MTDRPIIFSAPMVRTLLAGRKTQTRRVVEPCKNGEMREGDILVSWPADAFVRQGVRFRPRYRVGDRLWVREAWRTKRIYDLYSPSQLTDERLFTAMSIQYDAGPLGVPLLDGKSRPSMFMPRWASRITLTVTEVRIQRLQEITEEDAIAEGIERVDCGNNSAYRGMSGWRVYNRLPDDSGHPWNAAPYAAAARSYQSLWDSLNAGRGCGWETNPWVIALTFTAEQRNIDMKEAA